MLFQIYAASLITLSSAVALQKRGSWPEGQVRCKLFVYVGNVGLGWIRGTVDKTLSTTGPNGKISFADATEFKWGVPLGQDNAMFPTLKITDAGGRQEEIAWDNQNKRSLTFKSRFSKGFTGVGWTPPLYNDNIMQRPTELIVEDLQGSMQYCTPKDGGAGNLQANAGDNNYSCTNAVVFVRFIQTETIDTFPQQVKIGLYTSADLKHIGWLGTKADGRVYYADDQRGMFTYDYATVFTLKSGGSGKIMITSGNRSLRMMLAGDQTDNVPNAIGNFGFFADGVGDEFEWAGGNPHQIIPTGVPNIMRCDSPDDLIKPGFRKTALDPLPQGWKCDEVLWIISATG